MDDDQQFCLRWNNHQSTLISVFDTLLENETLVDCTLAAEGRFMKAHKVVLSACSPYFATLLQQQYDKHPIFILKDVKYQELRAMMDYMYRGEVNISQDQLAALLKAAESLQIKGLSDNRSGSGAGSAPRQEIPHQRASIPGGKHGYTLEQTKRARLGPGSGIEQQEIVSGSREGSSSPSRRRRKPRRRSIDNDVHDNSNSSANQQPNASLAGSAITASALASQMTAAAAAAAAASAVVSPAALASAVVSSQQQSGTQQQQAQLTTNVPKKTETIKGTTSDAMNNENIQATTSGTAIVGSGAAGVVIGSGAATVAGGDEQDNADKVEQKSNHKQKSSNIGKDASTIPSGELTIEPKSEYDDEGNDENVEDLTLDEEEMGMDDLDHNAGTSQGGEGSSQGYAAWQHDNRSQDELLLTTQDAQQRDPQDLSITRIAGLSWNEWNARLAMPLVTQLREGIHPLVFPTDLSVDKPQPLSAATASTAGTTTTAQEGACTVDEHTQSKSESEGAITENASSTKHETMTPPNELNDVTNTAAAANAASTPINHNTKKFKSSARSGNEIKLKYLSEEEATALMLKAAAEKNAANNSGNMSDTSYGEENLSNAGGAGDTGGSTSDYHSALTGAGSFGEAAAAAAAAAGLCNINILSSISAMNSLISGGGGSAGGGGGNSNGGGNTSGNSPGSANNSSSLLSAGSGSGGGHPCPECGRVYKLKSSLRNHQKWECGKEPQFQCPFCVYRAKQKMHIGRHMERMHKEKFIKLEDIKSFTTVGGSGAAGGGDDSNNSNNAVAAVVAAAAAAAAAGNLAAELRQHFS